MIDLDLEHLGIDDDHKRRRLGGIGLEWRYEVRLGGGDRGVGVGGVEVSRRNAGRADLSW